MARFACALLCEAATVREGLLNILGGGVTRVVRPSFPAPLDLTLALAVLLEREEVDGDHRVSFRVAHPVGGHEVASGSVEFVLQVPADGLGVDEVGSLALAIPIDTMLPEEGTYRVDVEIDGGKASQSLMWRATLPAP